MSAMLQVRGLSKRFGGLTAVKNLSFDLNEGEIVGLIGPNGAGKSTAFNLIGGTLAPSAGSILFDGHEIAGCKPSQVVRYGLARTFQSASVYTKSTVAENVYRGAIAKFDIPVWAQVAQTAAYRNALKIVRHNVDEILEITDRSARP